MNENPPTFDQGPAAASPPPPPRRGGSNTCLTILGIGCLGMLILAVAAGLVIYFKGGDIVRAGAAKVTEAAVEEMLKELQIPAGEREAAMAPVREFAQQIRAKKVSWEQGGEILKEVAEGPVSVVVMARTFEVKYLQPSPLSPEEKAAGHVNVSRFAHGISEAKIPREKGQPILDIITEKGSDSRGRNRDKLRDSITGEELARCLKIAKDEADAAGIENKEHPIDLAREIRKAIDRGMNARGGPGTPPSPEVPVKKD